MHRRILIPTLAALALTGLLPAAAAAAGGSSAPSAPATPTVTPEVQAINDYNRALKYRDKAWSLEEDLAAADGAQAGKLSKKIDKEYQKAIRALRSAIEAAPAMYQAHSSLGYALRKSGEYRQSLEAYDRALQLNPVYTEAIEYRAEAHLALNQLGEVKDAYMKLFRSDRERADELMAAMESWVETRRADPKGLDRAVVAEFSDWLEERSELARQTASLSASPASSW